LADSGLHFSHSTLCESIDMIATMSESVDASTGGRRKRWRRQAKGTPMKTLLMTTDQRGDSASSLKSAIRSMHATRGRARQFVRVFNKSLVPMMIVDNQRRYTDANAAARLIFRMSIAEFRTHRID